MHVIYVSNVTACHPSNKYLSNVIKISAKMSTICTDTCLEMPFTFQQDSAPAHHVCETIGLLQRETPDLILPGLWPPNSLDLNPVDYILWGVIAQRVYQSRVKTFDKLKER